MFDDFAKHQTGHIDTGLDEVCDDSTQEIFLTTRLKTTCKSQSKKTNKI